MKLHASDKSHTRFAFWMVCMPLPRPPLHVDVTPTLRDVLAMVAEVVAAVGTATVLLAAASLYVWQFSRVRRQKRCA